MYKCECGKEFVGYRQYNGHRSSHFRTEQYKIKRSRPDKPQKTFICRNCNNSHVLCANSNGWYCSFKCQQEFKYKETIAKWLAGEVEVSKTVPNWLRRYIRETRGYQCALCGISEWNNQPLSLDLDHIDGNHANNELSNLRYLCPNCHSQTPTYKSKNKGNGRKARRKADSIS